MGSQDRGDKWLTYSIKTLDKLLNVIASGRALDEHLTYSSFAVRMGRPPDHSRAMASTCNLLDAAACLGGVPLLALVAVLAQSGDVNPAAFAREFDENQRKVIVRRSQLHQFVVADYDAISKGLDDLGDKGAVKPGSLWNASIPGTSSTSGC